MYLLPAFIRSLSELRERKKNPHEELCDEAAQFPPAGPAHYVCHTPRLMIHLLGCSKAPAAPELLSIAHGGAAPRGPPAFGAPRRTWENSALPSGSSCSARLAPGVGKQPAALSLAPSQVTWRLCCLFQDFPHSQGLRFPGKMAQRGSRQPETSAPFPSTKHRSSRLRFGWVGAGRAPARCCRVKAGLGA